MNRAKHRNLILGIALTCMAVGLFSSCGVGIPVRVRIDQFTFDLSLDDIADQALAELAASDILPQGLSDFPEFWPDELPPVKVRTSLSTEPVAIDLTPEEGDPNFDTFEDINQVDEVITRIELNRFILRFEQSNLTVGLPELNLQIADDPDADPEDRLAWRTVGRIAAVAEARFVGDLEFEFLPGGESFLNLQLSEGEKDFAVRVQGNVDIDTELNPLRPSGAAVIRLIAVATFFVDPTGAL